MKTASYRYYRPSKHPYPENLLIQLAYGEIFEENLFTALTDDQKAGLAYSISTLNPTERDILKLRYEDLLKWRQIGEIYGRSAQTIRQRAHNAIWKLSLPSRLGYILFGMQGNPEWKEWPERRRIAEKALSEAPLVDTPEAFLEQLDCIPVEGVGLSFVSLYSLLRNGITTIGQLYRVFVRDPQWTDRMQLLGQKGVRMRQLYRALKRYGQTTRKGVTADEYQWFLDHVLSHFI